MQVIPAAVAAEMSIRTLCLAARSRASNHLAEFGTTQTGGEREHQSVVAITLDWLMESLPAPSLVKIDVEGAELEVLKGASRLFETIRPIVLCEVIPASEPGVTEFFKDHGYQIFDGELPLGSGSPFRHHRGARSRFQPEARVAGDFALTG